MIDDLRGTSIGDYVLQDKVGEGGFSVVYLAVNRQTDEPRAFKIARDEVDRTAATNQVWARALMDHAGNIGSAPVKPSTMLSRQFQYLQEAGPALFARVDALVKFGDSLAMQMEFLEGLTLRELMLAGQVSDEVLLRLARTLAELERWGLKHGDLKPENIFVAGERVALLDPGFFGDLHINNVLAPVRVTTPEYYPFLQPQDLTALGLILLELATGVRLSRDVEEGRVGPGLAARLQQLHMGNNYFFDSIGQISRGARGGELLAASPLEPIILKALGLQSNPSGQIDVGYKYPGVEALEVDLQALLGSGRVFSPAASPAESPRSYLAPPPGTETRPEPGPPPVEELRLHCSQPFQGEEKCPHCGVSCAAPPCPRCGQPVSRTRNHRESSPCLAEIAWNSHWGGACAHCGLNFESTLRLLTGHPAWHARGDGKGQEEFQLETPMACESILQIRGAESTSMALDDWDFQPTIEVRIKRAVADGGGKTGGGLDKEVVVTMTPEEWDAVFKQLHGPLRLLMQRRIWSRDTT